MKMEPMIKPIEDFSKVEQEILGAFNKLMRQEIHLYATEILKQRKVIDILSQRLNLKIGKKLQYTSPCGDGYWYFIEFSFGATSYRVDITKEEFELMEGLDYDNNKWK